MCGLRGDMVVVNHLFLLTLLLYLQGLMTGPAVRIILNIHLALGMSILFLIVYYTSCNLSYYGLFFLIWHTTLPQRLFRRLPTYLQ